MFAPVRVHELTQDVRREQRRIAGENEHVAFDPGELRVRSANRVARAERLALHGHVEAVEHVGRRRRGDDDDRLRAGFVRRGQHPVDDAPAEQRMQVLRRGRAHAGPESGGHDDGCDVLVVS